MSKSRAVLLALALGTAWLPLHAQILIPGVTSNVPITSRLVTTSLTQALLRTGEPYSPSNPSPSPGDEMGKDWLRNAALALPQDRVVFDESNKVLHERNVIGYAPWDSNDPNRHGRHLGFKSLSRASRTGFVCSNGRTFALPPDAWTIGTWRDKRTWFAGAPQTLAACYVHDGVLEASMPALSWMNIVVNHYAPSARQGKRDAISHAGLIDVNDSPRIIACRDERGKYANPHPYHFALSLRM